MPGRSSRHYVLRSIRDPNYAVGLVDRMESECVAFRGNHQPHGTIPHHFFHQSAEDIFTQIFSEIFDSPAP
jgi:hypothetical protein